MSTGKSQSPKQINEFCTLLAHYHLYEPEELYKVVCPFHADNNASMQINIPQCFYFCYAECSPYSHGGSLELYKGFEALEGRYPNDMEAMLAIKKIVRKYQQKQLQKGTQGGSLYASDSYTNYISNNLSGNPLLKGKVSYKEGIEQARDFYFNLPEVNWYRPGMEGGEEGIEAKHYMKRRGYSAMTLQKYGAKVTYNKYYPIVFPLFESGVFRGYVMRTFDKQVEGERKYMYNRGFKRERTLPGDFKTDTVLLVEGYLDKLKANQLGIQNVVALLGWKISSTHLKKLKRAGVKKLVCGTDNDEAGKKGWNYLKRIATTNGFLLERLRYPKGIKDMGDVMVGTNEAEKIVNQVKRYGGY